MELINQLRLAGFATDDISAWLPDKTGLRDFGYERHTKAPEGALVGGLLGALLGAALSWLDWLGVLPMRLLEPLVAAGVGVAALGCASVGALAGGVLGALAGLACPEYEARRYQGKVPGDNILISVHCDNSRAVRRATHIFKTGEGGGVATGIEAPCGSIRPSVAQPAVQPA